MIEKISLRIFITFMLLCAATAIVLLWIEPQDETYFKAIPTLFIIGLASFLIWGTTVVYRGLESITLLSLETKE